MERFTTALCGIILGLGAVSFTPAAAQDGDIVVTGPFVELPDGRMIASQTISYSDLDLNYADDRAELRRHVSMSAREICSRLRFRADGPILNSDCEEGAMSGAFNQVRAREGDWAVRR